MPKGCFQKATALPEWQKPRAPEPHISHSTGGAVCPEIPHLGLQMRHELCLASAAAGDTRSGHLCRQHLVFFCVSISKYLDNVRFGQLILKKWNQCKFTTAWKPLILGRVQEAAQAAPRRENSNPNKAGTRSSAAGAAKPSHPAWGPARPLSPRAPRQHRARGQEPVALERTGLGRARPSPRKQPEEKLFLIQFLSCDWPRQAQWLGELHRGPMPCALLLSKSPPSPPASACTHRHSACHMHPQAQRGKDEGIKISLKKKQKGKNPRHHLDSKAWRAGKYQAGREQAQRSEQRTCRHRAPQGATAGPEWGSAAGGRVATRRAAP